MSSKSAAATLFVAAAMSLTSFSTPRAADAPDVATAVQQFGQAAKANAVALKAYSWKMRVAVTLKGQAKPAKLFQMRYDRDGKLQKTELTAAAPPPPKQRGLRGRMLKRKVAEAKEYAADLAELCKGYLAPSAEVLQAFFARATTAQTPGGTLQLSADGVISPGDRLTYEIDAQTHALRRIAFHATLDGDPVDGSVEMSSVPGGGPNYAARTIVKAPGKNLMATIENYEYVRQ